MKYTINGFSQEKLIEYKLDNTDSLILRWFIDFKESGQMKTFIIKDEKYYWLLYDYLITEIPILNIKKDTLYRKLRKLVKAGILINKTRRIGGTFSLYAIGETYKNLISNSDMNPKLSEINPTITGNKSENCRIKIPIKDSSIKDSSIKNTRGTLASIEDKERFLKFVLLTKEEHNKLLKRYGKNVVKKEIDDLNDYIGQLGKKGIKKYDSHYYTICRWLKRAKVPEIKPPKICPKCKKPYSMTICHECGWFEK